MYFGQVVILYFADMGGVMDYRGCNFSMPDR